MNNFDYWTFTAPSILAGVELLTNVPEPKINGVRTGYRPLHSFKSMEGFFNSGIHDYGDDNLHYAGEKLLTFIGLISWEYIHENVNVGDEFQIHNNGTRLIGVGKVIYKNEYCAS